jgi:hypothetical protein
VRLSALIAVAAAMDLAILEHGGGIAENEIHGAGYVAVDIILASGGGVECVLPTEEPAVAQHRAIGIEGQGDSLRARAECVFEGDVLRFETVAVDSGSGAEKSSAGLFRAHGGGDNGGLGILADEADHRHVGRDDDSFLVGARSDLNDQTAAVGGSVVERVVDGALDGREVAAAILCHYDADGRGSGGQAGSGAQEQQQGAHNPILASKKELGGAAQRFLLSQPPG